MRVPQTRVGGWRERINRMKSEDENKSLMLLFLPLLCSRVRWTETHSNRVVFLAAMSTVRLSILDFSRLNPKQRSEKLPKVEKPQPLSAKS